MSDSISPEHRSWNMSRIRGKDTKIEVLVRKYLFSICFLYSAIYVGDIEHFSCPRDDEARMIQYWNEMED